MRYTELLEEDLLNKSHGFVSQIRVDCVDFLKSKDIYTNLIRADDYVGNRHFVPNVDFTTMRDSKKIYSDPWNTEILHKYLDNRGFRATRSRGKFCYKESDIKYGGAVTQSTMFGLTTYACFPVGTNWELMYIKSGAAPGFTTGDYGGDGLMRRATQLYIDTHSGDADDKTMLEWFLSEYGDKLFNLSKNVDEIENKHECVLYAPKVHMLHVHYLEIDDVQKNIYSGIID